MTTNQDDTLSMVQEIQSFTFPDLQDLMSKAETGEQFAHICLLEQSATRARVAGLRAVAASI